MKKQIILSIVSLFAVAAMPAVAQEQPDTVETTGTRGFYLSGQVLNKKMAGDIRTSMLGLMPGLEITSESGGYWHDDYSSNYISDGKTTMAFRGTTSLTCIIDGVVMPFNTFSLDPSQVESVRLLGDIVDRTKYGPMASNGSIYIKTKTGGYNQPLTINVNAEGGVATTGLIPEWVDGVDYAILNNQARANSGYTQLYSPVAIQNFLRGDAYDLQYPNVDYRSLFLKPILPVGNISVAISGGGDKVKYAASLSEFHSGDIVNTGYPQDYNRINMSANVTSRIKDFITLNAGFNSLLGFRRHGAASWNDWMDVPPVAFPVILGTNFSDSVGDELDGLTIYGTTAQFTNNPYAKLIEGGNSTRKLRSGMIFLNAELDFDQWVKGLKSVTSLSYSTFSAYTISKSEDYLSYYWNPAAEDGKGIISPTHQGVKSSGRSYSANSTSQVLQLQERLTWDWAKNGHAVNLGASFLMYNAAVQGDGRYRRMMQTVADAKYAYKNRYVVEGAFQYAGSSRFDKEHRFHPFASAGVAWVASNEDFIKNASWIDYLKIKAQYGVIGTYENAFGSAYRYQSEFDRANSGTFGPILTLDTWFGTKTWTAQKTTLSKLANPNLDWEKFHMWQVGLDFDFCKDFTFSATVYGQKTIGEIVNANSSVPRVFGIPDATIYANIASNKRLGYELSLGWRHSFGDFTLFAAANAAHWNTVYNKVLNDDYLYEYQKKTGTSTSDIWGLECIGKYQTQEQVETIPSYSTVTIGDLMYKDQNNDGKIDSNDEKVIGNTQPALRYSVRLGFEYKGLALEIVGMGRTGYDYMCNSAYFWNGWGDGNYSAFVRDNLGGAYPNISYVKSENNFVNSTFWMRDVSWFKLQNVNLSYDIPLKNKKVLKGLSVKLEGQNLATLTNLEYVDPESPASGVSKLPLFRVFTAGVKFKF